MAPSISEDHPEAHSGMFHAEAEQSSFKTELELEQNVLDNPAAAGQPHPEPGLKQSEPDTMGPASCESISEPFVKQSMPDTDTHTLQEGSPTCEPCPERAMEPSVQTMELHPHSQLILPAMGDLELPAQLPPSCDIGLRHDLAAQPVAPTADAVAQLSHNDVFMQADLGVAESPVQIPRSCEGSPGAATSDDVTRQSFILQPATVCSSSCKSNVVCIDEARILGRRQDTFLPCDGCIPAGSDLLVAHMSIEEAKAKCKELPGCCGFTFQGCASAAKFCIYFKSRWSVAATHSVTWTSFMYVSASQLVEPLSAEMLVHMALQPDSNLDFPQITEVCERAEGDSRDMTCATGLLVAVLRGPVGFKEKLKVLTIMNEMLYNAQAVSMFCQAPGLRKTLEALRSTQATGLGAAADENIRMLATEIDKACAVALLDEPSPTSSSTSSAGSAGCSGRRRPRLPSAPSPASLRSAFERKTSAIIESAEKVATASFSSALTSAEKRVDSTTSSMHKALKDVHSYVLGELHSLSSGKMRPSSLSTWQGPDGSPKNWTPTIVERKRQIPTVDLDHVEWEHRPMVL